MFLAILHHYLLWHYSRAYIEWFNVWTNLLWFVVNFFSIPQLIRSWFSPWKRMTEERTKAWDFEDFAGTILINLLSRIIGAMLRTVVIAMGLVALAFMMAFGVLVYALWLIAPILILALIITGVVYIISSL